MKLKIERNKEGRYRAPEDVFNLTFETEWEARAFYLEVEMSESWAMHGDDPSMKWDWFRWNLELRYYKAWDWIEKRPWACGLIAGLVGAIGGWIFGANI